MFFRLFKKVNANAELFHGPFIDVKALYASRFNVIPSVTFIGELDLIRVYAYFKENFKEVILATYGHSYYNYNDQAVYSNCTILVLSNKRIIELADDFCQVLHTAEQYAWAEQLVNNLEQFRNIQASKSSRHTHVVGFAKEATMN